MKSKICIILLCALPIQVLASSQGIKETNFGVSTAMQNSDYGNNVGLGAFVRAPLFGYSGMYVSASYSDINAKKNAIDASSIYSSIGLILKDRDIGEIGINYGHSNTKYDSTLIAEGSVDYLSIDAAYYVKDFDITLDRTRSETNSNTSRNYATIGVAYYIHENLQIKVSDSRIDGDSSRVSIYYQPKAFGENLVLGISYQDSDLTNSYGLYLAYYFDIRENYKNRVRRY